MPAKDSIVVGFDPGTAVSGWAALRGTRDPELIACGAIRARSTLPIETRLRLIHEGAVEILERYQPTAVAVEDPFVGKNPTGALTLGQARGVILLAAAQRELAVTSYPPATIKLSVVGNGGADKEQVRQMVVRLLGLSEPPEPLDASDAVAVALCHMARGGWGAGPTLGGRGSQPVDSGATEEPTSATNRARKLAARSEDADALARWLAGGKSR